MPLMHEIQEPNLLLAQNFAPRPLEKPQQNRKQGDYAKYHHITKPHPYVTELNQYFFFFLLTTTLVTDNI